MHIRCESKLILALFPYPVNSHILRKCLELLTNRLSLWYSILRRNYFIVVLMRTSELRISLWRLVT